MLNCGLARERGNERTSTSRSTPASRNRPMSSPSVRVEWPMVKIGRSGPMSASSAPRVSRSAAARRRARASGRRRRASAGRGGRRSRCAAARRRGRLAVGRGCRTPRTFGRREPRSARSATPRTSDGYCGRRSRGSRRAWKEKRRSTPEGGRGGRGKCLFASLLPLPPTSSFAGDVLLVGMPWFSGRPRSARREFRTARPDYPDRTFRDRRSACSNIAQQERRANVRPAFRRNGRSLLRVDSHIAGTYPVGGATISRLTTGRTEMDETIQAHHGIVVRAARVVPARPEEVYRMFTDAALIPKWWGRTAKAVLLACEMDPRAGGRFRFALRTEKGAEDAVTGHYSEV